MKQLTQKRLKELLHYDPDTGVFTWKVRTCNNVQVGDLAGGLSKAGYHRISVNKKRMYSHRLAWLYCYGYLPEAEVDHINRNKSDNRIVNLREASRQCNNRNASMHKTNTSGIMGVTERRGDSWIAQISVDNKNKYLGYSKSFDEAVRMRWEGEVKYDFPTCNTTSSAYQYLVNKNIIRVSKHEEVISQTP